MSCPVSESPADRFRSAIDMHAFGVAMYRQRVVREHPQWRGDEIDADCGNRSGCGCDCDSGCVDAGSDS